LAASPLYDGQAEFDIYICQSDWRQRLFFNLSYGVGGVALVPVTSNVFIRNSSIEENRVIGNSGAKVPCDRTLDYFIAHEIAHVLTWRKTGTIGYFLLPAWVREGTRNVSERQTTRLQFFPGELSQQSGANGPIAFGALPAIPVAGGSHARPARLDF